jgi:hypothetical protein
MPTASAVPTDLPALTKSAVPFNLKPSLAYAKSDRAKPYGDHCHVQQNLTSTNAACIYGDPNSDTTIVLFGDSHALSWFPAIEKLANAKDWKLVSLTMSSCWPADINAYNPVKNIAMDNCAVWRQGALKEIADLHPEITFIAGTRGFSTLNDSDEIATGEERTQLWIDGMNRTLKSVTGSSINTVYLGDYPISTVDTPVCLQKNLRDLSKCATPSSRAIDSDWLITESSVAKANGAIFVDPENWICKTEPCSPIDGKRLIYLDAGHLTATFAVTLEAPLWRSISGTIAF